MANNETKQSLKSIPEFDGSNKKGDTSFTIQPNLYSNGALAIQVEYRNTEDNKFAGSDIITTNPENIDKDNEPNVGYIKMTLNAKEIIDAMVEKELATIDGIEFVPVDEMRLATAAKLEELGIKGIYDEKRDLTPKKYLKVTFTDDVRNLAMLNRSITDSKE